MHSISSLIPFYLQCNLSESAQFDSVFCTFDVVVQSVVALNEKIYKYTYIKPLTTVEDLTPIIDLVHRIKRRIQALAKLWRLRTNAVHFIWDKNIRIIWIPHEITALFVRIRENC